MSRDPDGLDPDELDKAPRLEPAGFRSETVAAVNAIKAVKAARRQRKLESLKNMDVAKLVGVPPPPPKTPPPKKAHRQTPKAASSPSEGAKFQFTDTKEISDESLVETAQVDEVKSDFPMRAAGVGDIIPPPPPPPPAAPRDVQKTRVSAEQRRQATLAKYQHEDAVLDREETLLAEELLRPAITKKSEEDQKVVESRLAMAFSPSSEVTKHHSNQRNEMLSRPVQHGISSAANYSSPSADEEKEVEKKQESRKRGFSLERKNKSENKSEKSKEAKQKRGFFQKLFRGKGKEGGSSQERSSTNKSKQVDPPVVQEPKGQESSIDSELISVPQKSKNESDALSNDSVPSVQQPALKPVLKGVSERQYQGDPDPLLTDMVMPTTDSTLGTAQVEDENLLISSKLSNDGSLKAPKSFSQDPPDDEHGDPPVYSGRPLVSPRSIHPHLSVTVSEDEEEQSRIESVRSRIADVYGEHLHAVHHNQDEHAPITGVPSSLSDKPDYFFHNDEVSALTGICPSKSFDPSPFTEGSIDSDPQGDYNIPRPSTKAQDGGPSLLPGSNMIDPYSASPSNKTDNGPLPTPAHLSHLRVQVPARSMDPAGDSPFYAGTGGRQASHTFGDPVGESPIAWNKTNLSTNDPVGESPCHAAGRPDGIEEGEFADPELTAGYLSEDSSCSGAEEKKEEEEQVEEKPSDAAKVQESTTESSSGNIVTPAIPEAPKDNDAMSNISQAALKIVKSSGTDAIIAQLNALPSPAHKGSSNDRVGSTPVSSDAKNLQVDTDMKMSGFRSGSNTPASTKKALTVTAAAFTNAKAVAYLHRLQGEPSPRHSWRVSKKKQGEQSPVSHAPVESKGKKKKGKKKGKVIAAQKKAPSPDEYGAHNLPQMQPSDEEDENQGPREDVTPKASHVGQRKPPSPEVLMSKLPEKPLSVYNSRIGCHSKFQGRKPKKDAPIPEVALKKPKTVPEKPVQPVIRVGKITKIAVTKGLQMRRNKRKDDIESGRATPVVVTPRQKPAGRNRFNFVPTKESEIKDPIQRAGRRLLSKAAVPIQTVARRYIAKREAVNRMWALIVIQSAFRRWRCEVNLQASLHSAKVVQTAFRGWFIREKVKDMHFSATQIQKIVRGHLAAAHVYDTIYYVVRIQALLRGCYSRKCDVKKREAAAMIQKYCRGHLTRFNLIGASKVLPIQALYRGHKARREMKASFTAVSLIQSTWRSYSARMSFQFQIVDVIIVQSIARRWAACRRTKILKHMEHGPAGHSAAQKIQASWRGYQCYTDYIFALVDILVAQRTVRQWLAVKKANALRQETKQEKAAIQLQKQWRRHKAQLTLLYSMVHIIIVQVSLLLCVWNFYPS